MIPLKHGQFLAFKKMLNLKTLLIFETPILKLFFVDHFFLQVEKQTVGIKENSEALKGITKDSIGENI